MSEQQPITIDEIVSEVKQTQPGADINLILSAYELASEAHEGQKRVSGEAYIIHPLNVAYILADMHLDEAAISAALLHDVVEDTTF
ncbi:MAG: HD domain-containing protein, partial [Oscillospiraceae bacterium]|nr:HD domain-containing protein [Oscillospiraceae bacterium]